jgi:hypothetical protein
MFYLNSVKTRYDKFQIKPFISNHLLENYEHTAA